jgi:DNA ligase (NAD+)
MDNTDNISDFSVLCAKIDELNYKYYELGVSEVTDKQFDSLISKLRLIDPNNDRLKSVGVKPTLDKVEHDYPMGSLDNIDMNKSEELNSYVKRNSQIGEVSYHVTPKIDGSSIALYYKDGILDKVLTRGNGFVGQDITAKAHFFKNVPINLKEPITAVIRGEAVMLRSDFNQYITTTGVTGVKNPRNVGNGLIVRKDLMGAGLITFYAFDMFADDINFDSVHEIYMKIKGLGLETVNYIVSNDGGLSSAINVIYSDEYPFDIDGVVVKVNDSEFRSILNEGCDELRLRSDRAVKYNSKKEETIVTGVNFTVGSTGRVTPTLIVEPVEIGGVVVSNVLVYNFEEIERLNLGIGDKVLVVLAGDIIPKILSVVDKNSTDLIIPPKECPCCSKYLERKMLKKGLSVDFHCVNKNCPAIRFEKIKGFIGSSKRGMGILGIGDNLLHELIDSGLVKTFSDLYRLKLKDIVNIKLGNGVLGEKRALSILDNILKSKENSISKTIGSLGIDGFAESRIDLIMKQSEVELNSLRDWIDDIKLEYISKMKSHYLPADTMVYGVSEIRSMKDEIERLCDLNLCSNVAVQSMESENPKDPSKMIFLNKSFCFTGTRELLKEVENTGGVIKSGVSKGLDYLVQKDATSDSSKSNKARSLGIKVISVDDIRNCLESGECFI